jgi:hypothetical protein
LRTDGNALKSDSNASKSSCNALKSSGVHWKAVAEAYESSGNALEQIRLHGKHGQSIGKQSDALEQILTH